MDNLFLLLTGISALAAILMVAAVIGDMLLRIGQPKRRKDD